MRRKTAILLAVLLAVQNPVSVSASAVMDIPETQTPAEDPENESRQQDIEETEENKQGETDPATPADAEPYRLQTLALERTGNLAVQIRGVVPSKRSVWQLELYPSDGTGETLTGQIGPSAELPASDGSSYVSAYAVFEEIPAGKYDLRLTPLSGDDHSYLPYEQKGLVIGDDMTTLYLMNDRPQLHGYTDEQTAGRFGMLLMGDINDDGVLDDGDKEVLVDILASEEYPRDVYYERADLNGDGEVDLLDMTAFVKYYESGAESRRAQPVKSILIRAGEVTETHPDNTSVTGALGDVLAGTSKTLQMQSAGKVISEAAPVEIAASFEEARTMGGFVIDPVNGSGGSIRDGQIIVEDAQGRQRVFAVHNGKVEQAVRTVRASFSLIAADQENEMLQGLPIVIDLKGQVAVKKITIKVTKTMDGGNIADISSVEFYGDMKERIPEAPMSVPERVAVDNGSECFTLTWKRMPNVTGYQVTVTGVNSGGVQTTDTYDVETAELAVSGLGDGKLVNGSSYQVQIRSVNGAWRSRAAQITAEPRAMGLPPAPENLEIKAGIRRLTLGWKAMKDTESYTLYYRETSDIHAAYRSVPDIRDASYILDGLKDETEYEIYLTGTNPIGEGPESLHYVASTVSLDPPKTPNYKLINVPVSGSEVTAHIVSVEYGGEGEHQFDVADGRYDTAWVRNDWDAGYAYPGENKAPAVTFDREYQMDTIVVIPDGEQTFSLTGGTLYCRDGDGTETKLPTVMTRRVSSNKKVYYVFQTAEPFTAKRVQLQLGNAYGVEGRISIAEMKFYYYDPIEHDIMDLYEDSYHVVLRRGVTLADINRLRARLLVKDSVSGELHPKKEQLEAELDNAERILKDGGLQSEILRVDTKDTVRSDGHITFKGGLNTFQPLGVTALAGETVTVYVGGPVCRNGDTTRLELIVSQYHGSSKAVFKSMGYLKAGANTVTVEALDDMNLERGGQLYVEYTGNAGEEEYGVRVSGGYKSSVLDLSDVTDEQERIRLAEQYLTELSAQESGAESDHAHSHPSYGWDPRNCVFEATDIVTRYGMMSTAAQQVLAGLGNRDIHEMAVQLEQSMTAFDQMMVLFYQHKGLSEDPQAPASNRMPAGRINIRYQRMFAGAFMYAGGRHIGIEWPELAGLMGGVPVSADPDGRYRGEGQYFGWGIAHEIGHEINEGVYAVAEVTNNYFAVLAQAKDTNDSVRYDYDDVFRKVTSGTKGKAADVFVRLAMYWQLHLAYDLDGYNYKTYADNGKQLENLFFARVDSYVRDLSTAPGAADNRLSLDGADTDNRLMRLAVAASEKNILEFFRRWGLEPDSGTVRYASQFPEETRGIWFANDEIRAEQIRAGAGQNMADGISVGGTVSYTAGSSRVRLDLSAGAGGDAIWLYEISRYERIRGEIVRRPAGYAWADGGNAVYTDVIGTINNHTFTYEVTGYDRWLNPTETAEIGTVKVSHDGQIDKSLWTVTTNLTNENLEQPGAGHPDTTFQPGTENMIDGNPDTGFTGSTEAGTDPEIIIDLGQEETITGFVYETVSGTPIDRFEIYVSTSGDDGWKQVTTTEKQFSLSGGRQTVYFHDSANLYTYDASRVRLEARGQSGKPLTISEISLLGQTGDDISFADTGGIGILRSEYTGSSGEKIPQGSLIFTGQYKGNPAFNTVLLWDENGNLVGGTDADGSIRAAQIIFAPQPAGGGLLGEISSGTWVYYVEPEYAAAFASRKVRAELYRVDNALTNEGERLVSSTPFVDVPTQLPSVVLDPGR